MASLGLTPEELRAVEQTRQRLSQLSSSINSLKNDVLVSNPLPNIDSLQASADILNLNVQAIVDCLAQNNDLFSRIAVHPSTNFPGRTQENVLLQLLRKKPEPDVDVYMDKGRQTLANLPVPPAGADGFSVDQNGGRNNYANDRDRERAKAERENKAKARALEDVWSQCRDMCGARITSYIVEEEGDVYTAEEREMGIENVRTGLRYRFDEEEREEEEDSDEEGEGEEEEEEEAGGDKGAAAGGGGVGGSDDVMIIDGPPPPHVPAIQAPSHAPGTAVDVLMRLVTRGQLTE
ncbi:mediator of RNA polymerase II transcription complex subunit 8-domain-containing protein [Xylariaceae sp. FL0594]|nr:mediator of RNA polymerase II transcription complex subunit 8-domain-containing protein [Xylariaceae sp. FL0594]